LEATRRFEELSLYQVRFDDLNGEKQTEDAFTRTDASEGRVASRHATRLWHHDEARESLPLSSGFTTVVRGERISVAPPP
jgi:hypothetical protein